MYNENDYLELHKNYLMHHGIKGMKWGERRYQNPDGTLTPEGVERYNKDPEYRKYLREYAYNKNKKFHSRNDYTINKEFKKNLLKDKDLRELVNEKNKLDKDFNKKYKNNSVKLENGRKVMLVSKEDEQKYQEVVNKIGKRTETIAKPIVDKYSNKALKSFNKEVTDQGKIFCNSLISMNNLEKRGFTISDEKLIFDDKGRIANVSYKIAALIDPKDLFGNDTKSTNKTKGGH